MANDRMVQFLNGYIEGHKIGESHGYEEEKGSFVHSVEMACIYIARELQEKNLIKPLQRNYNIGADAWVLQALEPTVLLEGADLFECLENGLSDHFECRKVPKKRKWDEHSAYQSNEERKKLLKFREFVKQFNEIDGLPIAIVKEDGFYMPKRLN